MTRVAASSYYLWFQLVELGHLALEEEIEGNKSTQIEVHELQISLIKLIIEG